MCVHVRHDTVCAWQRGMRAVVCPLYACNNQEFVSVRGRRVMGLNDYPCDRRQVGFQPFFVQSAGGWGRRSTQIVRPYDSYTACAHAWAKGHTHARWGRTQWKVPANQPGYKASMQTRLFNSKTYHRYEKYHRDKQATQTSSSGRHSCSCPQTTISRKPGSWDSVTQFLACATGAQSTRNRMNVCEPAQLQMQGNMKRSRTNVCRTAQPQTQGNKRTMGRVMAYDSTCPTWGPCCTRFWCSTNTLNQSSRG